MEMGVNRSREMGHGGRADTLMLILLLSDTGVM